MTICLTPEILRACYDFLSECPPFDRWNLPAGEDVIFKVVRNPQNFAMHSRVGKKHCIEVSTRSVGHVDTLVATMAHEMIHAHEGNVCAARSDVEHSAAFRNGPNRSVMSWDLTRSVFDRNPSLPNSAMVASAEV